MRRQIGAVLADQPDRGPDRLRHADTRPLHGRGEAAVTAPQPDRPGQLLAQEIKLQLEAGSALRVRPLARLLELLFELLEPSAVVLLGPIVQQGAEVRRPGADKLTLGEPRVSVDWTPRWRRSRSSSTCRSRPGLARSEAM